MVDMCLVFYMVVVGFSSWKVVDDELVDTFFEIEVGMCGFVVKCW